MWDLPLDEKYKLIVNTSGNRLASILTFYSYGTHTIIGSGIGNWQESSMLALKYNNIDTNELNFFNYDYNIGMRWSGYVTNLILDIGIFGVVFFIYYLIKIIFLIKYMSKAEYAFLFLFVFTIFFVGSVGTTTHWILFFIFYYEKLSHSKIQKLTLFQKWLIIFHV